jgi:alkaline phosphatase D
MIRHLLPLLLLAFTARAEPFAVPEGTRHLENLQSLPRRIAFGSCSHQDKPQPVLERVVEQGADLFVYLGDNIYGDTRDMAVLRAKYAKLGAKPEFQALRRAMPVAAIWDDHDYGENDAGKEYPRRAESKDIFLEFWLEPAASARRPREGIYAAHHWTAEVDGRSRTLQLLLLDTRTFRDPLFHNPTGSWKNDYVPDPDPAKTLLGPAQWAWLEEELRRPADVRVIASSIQFGHEYNGYESWTNLPRELLRMLDVLRRTRAGGVVFISGDVHWGEISRLRLKGKNPDLPPIYDVTSSGINQTWSSLSPNQNRVGEAVRDPNFGRIDIAWEEADPTLTFSLTDATGTRRTEHAVKLSELAPVPPR